MKNSKSIKYLFALALAVLMVGILPSCNEEDAEPDGPRPFADFTCVSSEANYLVMNFTNTSKFSTSYVWDFGGGATSTDENASHTFASEGIYQVTLTAANAEGETAISNQEIEVKNPDVTLGVLAGAESKKWIIQREGIALGIYAPDGGAWWTFGGNTPLKDRPCVIDDEITISLDGSIVVDTKNTVYLDAEADGGWNDALGAGCHDESDAGLWVAADGADVSDFANGGSYTYAYDKDAKQLTVSGSGFYIGLTSKTNGGDNPKPISSKTYDVAKLVDGDGVDSLQLVMDMGDGGKWIFNLVSYDDFSMAPDVPQPDPPLDATTELLIDHETAVAWEGFGGSAVEIVDNPDKTGINASDKVLKLTHGNETWAGIVTNIGAVLDFSGKTKLKVKLMASATGILKYKVEVEGGANQEIDFDITEVDKWVEYEWDLTADRDGNPVASKLYPRVVLFPGYDTTTGDVYYIDDITME